VNHSKNTTDQNSARPLSKWQRFKKLMLTPHGKRVPLGKNGAPHGIALFTVMIALALMSAVVVDFNYNEIIRYRLAVHERDSLRAQALAESGVQFSRLLLSVQASIQPMMAQVSQMGLPLPSFTIWELVPIDCETMKSLTDGSVQSLFGLNVDNALAARKEKALEQQSLAADDYDVNEDEGRTGPFVPPEAGFGRFTGTCSVEISDEERKPVSLRGWGGVVNAQERFATAQRLFAVFQPERYDFLFEDRDANGDRVTREELVANIFDWIDSNTDATDSRADPTDWGRQSGGAEDAIYSVGAQTPKNAHFDSPGELRLVHGFSDAHERAFGDLISIYGENKINILSAPQGSIETLVRTCAQDPTDILMQNAIWMEETLAVWQECKTLGVLGGCAPLTADGFVTFLEARGLLVNKSICTGSIAVESQNFTIRVTGQSGDVSRTVTVVMRVASGTEEVYYYGVR